MSNTIPHVNKCNWWNGEVLIDELKVYADDRGMVSETFRTDNTDSPLPKMCYISETNPFVMRGPHEHVDQTDTFITWKSLMLYQMYNQKTKEMKWYVTDPEKITRVIVKPGIVHSYRNISLDEVKTMNLPDQLFMGFEKKGWKPEEKIDEIRHEDKIKPSKTIWVLGAAGRLGDALTNKLFEDMDYHTYHVVPVYEKFTNNREGMTKLNKILNVILQNKSEDDIIVNCIAKSNVQAQDPDYLFCNFLLPKYIAEFSVKQKIKFVHFSTDYVYQQGNVSEYTKTKKMWEDWFNEMTLGVQLDDQEYLEKDYIKVIRLANLFSQDATDVHNALAKLYPKFKEGKVSTPLNLVIMPTDVEVLSSWISKEYLKNIDDYKQVINVSGKPYTFEQLFKMTNLSNELVVQIVEEPTTINNPDIFLNNPSFIELDCDLAIRKKFDTISKS
jgi:dTDP-4-dehydrorhamnose 3,5-epimerase